MAQTSAKPGLRERQRQETHQAIRRAAFDLTLDKLIPTEAARGNY